MKSGFKDNIPDKSGKELNEDKVWNYDAPKYDERSSCFVNAGNKEGIGKRQPVGHTGNAKQRVPCMPFGRVNTMRIDES